MKKLLLLSLTCILASCSKDEATPGIDHNCGTILWVENTSELNDGGIMEWMAGSSCGQGFEALKNSSTGPEYKIFYKGESRAKVKYLVARQGSNNTLYFRFESNNVPQSSIEHWESEGYTVTVQNLTGLEGAIY